MEIPMQSRLCTMLNQTPGFEFYCLSINDMLLFYIRNMSETCHITPSLILRFTTADGARGITGTAGGSCEERGLSYGERRG